MSKRTFHILGSGQLARMLALENLHKGYKFCFYSPFDSTPVDGLGTVFRVTETYSELPSLLSDLQGEHYLTFETENLLPQTLHILDSLTDKITIYPNPKALNIFSDRLLEKSFLKDLSIPTAKWQPATLENTQNREGLVKLRRGGFDGRGQINLKSVYQQSDLKQFIELGAIIEDFVSFFDEISLIAVSSINKNDPTDKTKSIQFYPINKNIHQNGILHSTQPMFNSHLQEEACQIADKIINASDYVGVITIEFFVTNNGLLVNEVAPRVHNSGHWTIEGYHHFSQFAAHIEAITGNDFKIPAPHYPHIKMINILGEIPTLPNHHALHLHDYLKSARKNRKVGHATIATHDLETLSTLENNLTSALEYKK